MSGTFGRAQQALSEQWEAQKDRALVVFDLHRKAEGKSLWSNMTDDEKTDPATYDAFVDFLVDTYKIKSGKRQGKFYSLPTMLATVRAVIHVA